MKYGIWKFVFTDEQSKNLRWESSYWMKASFRPGWIYIICKSSQVPRWQVRLVPLERDKFEGWRMKEDLGFWKIQHRICFGGECECETYQTTSPSNDHSFNVVFWMFFSPWAFSGCHDYHFCCAVLWSHDYYAKLHLNNQRFICRCYRWSFTWLHEWSSSWFRSGGSRGEPSVDVLSWDHGHTLQFAPLTFAEVGGRWTTGWVANRLMALRCACLSICYLSCLFEMVFDKRVWTREVLVVCGWQKP